MRRLMVGAAALIGLLTACGGTQVGNSSALGDANATGSAALGQDTPTPAPATAAAAAAPPATTTAAAPATHAPTAAPATKAPPRTPIPAPAQHFAVTIYGDNQSSSQFDPPAARVPRGTIITWTNKDTLPRSVAADDGSFSSGPLAAGASWTYTAATDGTFHYHDGTRPYAIAFFDVVG